MAIDLSEPELAAQRVCTLLMNNDLATLRAELRNAVLFLVEGYRHNLNEVAEKLDGVFNSYWLGPYMQKNWMTEELADFLTFRSLADAAATQLIKLGPCHSPFHKEPTGRIASLQVDLAHAEVALSKAKDRTRALPIGPEAIYAAIDALVAAQLRTEILGEILLLKSEVIFADL